MKGGQYGKIQCILLRVYYDQKRNLIQALSRTSFEDF